MKFEIEREGLLQPLHSVIGVVERRQTLPVLANVRVVASATGVELTATDLEVELRARFQANVIQEGETTLPARKLMDIVRNLPSDARISVAVDGDRAVLQAGRSRFTLATLSAGDFPTVDEIGESEPISVPQKTFKQLIDKTHFSMALQDVRYYLNGLLLEVEPGRLRAVATDGHRLVMAELDVDVAISENKQVIVPRKGIQELIRLLDNTEEPAEVELGSNHIRVNLPELRFTSKLIDGRFPDYQRVIPAGADKLAQVDRDALRQALVRASILSNEKYRGVRFSLEGETLRIQSNNPEQEEAQEELMVHFQGSPIEIGFNASYLLDALNAIGEGGVEIVLNDPNSSCLVRGQGSTDSKYVVMPMRL